ncbi:hypothetical protein LR48_Vigan07g204100 [Vigna angularis]|uniref:Uncharacterized protein n=1 Tax=Phaseolus angularis TaxID=3914 RepID=A0A0L9V0D9_PHAAN|nr:hypothetical protein LR48_Vigan07g204100 [Vigna angularis]
MVGSIRRLDSGKRRLDNGKRHGKAANGAGQRQTAANGAGTTSAAETKHTTQKGRSDNAKQRGGTLKIQSAAIGHRWGWSSREEANQIQWSPDEIVTVAGDKAAADWPERSAVWRHVTERWLSKPAWLVVARRDGPDPQVTRQICDDGRRQRRRRWPELAVTTAESGGDSSGTLGLDWC